MPKQTILWTTLPNGIQNGKLQLSVFVSPRLKPDTQKASLSIFPDFVDWPSVIKSMSFSADFENGPTIQAERVSDDPDSALWTAFFSNTFVESYDFDDYTNRFIHSYPVMNVLSTLKQVFQTVAVESPNLRPKIADLMSPNRIGQIANIDQGIELSQWADQLRQGQDRAVPPEQPNVNKDFLQTKWFHRPPGSKGLREEVVQSQPNVKGLSEIKAKYNVSQRAELPDAQDFADMIDFHKIVSSLGEFPMLMRSLGLVVDLQVALQDDIPTSSRISVTPNWNPSITSGAVPPPKTAYSLSAGGNQFVALSETPNDPEIVDGMLKLNDPGRYDLVQVDVDGLALKTMNFADNMARIQDPNKPVTSVDTPDDAGLPSLRSTGLSIVRTGRAFRQAQKFMHAKDKNDDITSQKDTTLFAEDLVRGFRIDVWDSKSSQWHSLCRRRGTYNIKPNITREIEDEGVVSAAVTGAADGSSDDFYMHESLFHWDGWSLCAPRPGGVIKPDDKVGMPSDNSQHPGQFKNEAPPGMPMETTFSVVPGSLPRLRFGLNYRLRARAVDLAGNSLGYEDPDPNDFSNALSAINANNVQLPYLRFEPIGSPVLVLRRKPGGGESLERLAIRSTNDDPSKDAIATTHTTDVHVAPPKTSQMTAELHGKFDDPSTGGMKKDAGTYNMIAQKDEGKWGEPPEGEFTIRSEAQLSLPYLPDPLAFGVTFRGLPGESEEFRCFPFESGNTWWDIRPFRLKLEEGSAQPTFGNGVLTVQLEKAEVARVRYSSHFRTNEQISIMGMWQWIVETNPPNLQELLDGARNGLHWMLTPFRELELVHAVQQPLLPLEIEELESRKRLGKTFAELDGIIAIHGKSSDKMDLMAEWEEPVDDPSDEANNPAEDKLAGQGRAFEAKIDLSMEYLLAGGGRARYMDEKRRLYLGRADPDFQPRALASPSPRHEFGDTKYRQVRYRAVATTRFREYFDTSITSVPENITRKSGDYVVDILNSARPAAPELLYAIPTFGWEETEDETTGKIISKRRGGGIRVYMERPWFSSGDGELLGIVLWPIGGRRLIDKTQTRVVRRAAASVAAPIPDEAVPYVTQWGMDPIWGSKPTPTRMTPSIGQFKNTKETKTGLSLDELPTSGNLFAVVGYEVHYDSERQLWYSDIEIDPGDSYYPFIRLALARFQPNSIEHTHLSRVVLADFAQLAPDRTVTLTRQGNSLKVLLSGVKYSQAPLGGEEGSPVSGTSNVEVTLENRDVNTNIMDDDLGWVPVSSSKAKLKPSIRREVQVAPPKTKLKPAPRKDEQIRPLVGWEWNFTLPDTGGQKEYRILIKEYEIFLADAEPRENIPLPPGKKFLIKEERRLVYAHSLRVG